MYDVLVRVYEVSKYCAGSVLTLMINGNSCFPFCCPEEYFLSPSCVYVRFESSILFNNQLTIINFPTMAHNTLSSEHIHFVQESE